SDDTMTAALKRVRIGESLSIRSNTKIRNSRVGDSGKRRITSYELGIRDYELRIRVVGGVLATRLSALATRLGAGDGAHHADTRNQNSLKNGEEKSFPFSTLRSPLSPLSVFFREAVGQVSM
ncbi:MAG: hypothetical protein ACHQNE_10220, partial [Candidatus Kapaibacterium sp.]